MFTNWGSRTDDRMTVLPIVSLALAGTALAGPSRAVGKPLEKINGCAFADTSCAGEIEWTSPCCRAGNCHYDRLESGVCVPVVPDTSSFDPGNCWVAEASPRLTGFGSLNPGALFGDAAHNAHADATDSLNALDSTREWDGWALKHVALGASAQTNFEDEVQRTYAAAMAHRAANESSSVHKKGGITQYKGPEWVHVATFNLGDCSSIPRGSIMTGSMRVAVEKKEKGTDVLRSVGGLLSSLADYGMQYLP